MGEFSIIANNRRFLALFVIFGVPLCKDNPGFGPPGKFFLSLLKVASKYLLAFFGAKHLSNSQTYEIIKFGPMMAPHRVEKFPHLLINVKLFPMCRQGNNILNLGDSHLYKVSSRIS